MHFLSLNQKPAGLANVNAFIFTVGSVGMCLQKEKEHYSPPVRAYTGPLPRTSRLF